MFVACRGARIVCSPLHSAQLTMRVRKNKKVVNGKKMKLSGGIERERRERERERE